jgi:hypothetical protein
MTDVMGRVFVMMRREWQTAAFLWLEFHLFTQLPLCLTLLVKAVNQNLLCHAGGQREI